ncbi:MAG: hypothetical protein K9G33_16520 [Sneathiella sp.]|nr:hypothetical protein [Sneathiella sp.]
MAKIPLPIDSELDDRTLKFIAGLPGLNIVRMLARTGIAPEIYTTVSAIFNDDWFPRIDREIMLFRTCRVNDSQYEIEQHMAYGGLDRAMVNAILSDGMDGLTEAQKMICRACDEITAKAKLSDGTVQALVRHYGGYNEACKAIFVMSWFNMLSRYVDSTGIPIEDGPDPYAGITGPSTSAGPSRK